MSNSWFQFKKFTVCQEMCATKVGTDGVLLGAWADCEGISDALDVGTGVGVIALMLAQRSPAAKIYAIDIDRRSCAQAQFNFQESVFGDRIDVENIALQEFDTHRKFDLIVSNPPFFSSSLRSLETRRSLARHDDSLSITDLIRKSVMLMKPQSRLAVILPYGRQFEFHEVARSQNLFRKRLTEVVTITHRSPKRILLEYANYPVKSVESTLIIEHTPGNYSSEYKKLMKDFYLKL